MPDAPRRRDRRAQGPSIAPRPTRKGLEAVTLPQARDEQFADAYAQTVTFALLLGRSEGADPLTLDSAEAALAAQHNLLSRALQVLTDPGARAEMAASLDLLLRVIAVVPPATLTHPEDPWLYFYEDFLADYDPKLRKDTGAYYTPVEVVRCQVRLIEDLLVNHLNKPLGFADPGVVTLDPAVKRAPICSASSNTLSAASRANRARGPSRDRPPPWPPTSTASN